MSNPAPPFVPVVQASARSSLGVWCIELTEDGAVTALYSPADRRLEGRSALPGDPQLTREAVGQLEAYFSGELKRFSLPLRPAGTPFQQEVWAALCEIPYGETRSYGELAAALGRRAGARAVGLANGANPIPVLIPCHRVIGADASLVGFGGGLALKQFLLQLESCAERVTPVQYALFVDKLRK
jgi:methylated-DNA-[protein]-cysteine S-methyltransferase